MLKIKAPKDCFNQKGCQKKNIMGVRNVRILVDEN